MSTLPSEATPETDKNSGEDKDKKRHALYAEQKEICKQYRNKIVRNMTDSVDYRRGKPFSSESDEDRIAINMDWSLTLAKQSQLFSQVPMIFVNHPPQTTTDETMPWVYDFQTRINDTMRVAGIEAAMDEVLPDCINAAGFGVVIVARETITQLVKQPKMDISQLPPEIQTQVMQTGMFNGMEVEMEDVPHTYDSRYTVKRLSPSDFLWPIDYTGSDFDEAPWIGRSGVLSWAEAKDRFNLSEDDKEDVIGDDRQPQDWIAHDVERDKASLSDRVTFDEIFYKAFQCSDSGAQNFNEIHHLVWVNGKKKPVVDEPWKGQEFDQESGELIGALRYPIRVLTLTYMTDEPLPPSDSAVSRPQINELNKSRTQVLQQRERSLPITTVDITRIDPLILQALMKGTVQRIIPVQGQGKILEEVARAHYPTENFTFDQMINRDLANIWRTPLDGKADEPINESMRTRISRDRAKVSKFFCTIAEVMGGLICLYEPPESFSQGFTPLISRALNYSILADTTVLLDSQQRLQMLKDYLDLSAKSGWMDIEYVLREIAVLSGLDPTKAIRKPEPKSPDQPNISLRLTGSEDMLNPLTMGFLIKSGQAPELKDIEQAKALIQASITPPAGMGGPAGMPPPLGPDGQPLPAPVGPDGQPLPPGMAPAPVGPVGPNPLPPPPEVGTANPGWTKMPHLDKRTNAQGEVVEGENQ